MTSCYDCHPKPSERKTYPICTIRSTPSEPIHCIVWAKSYLYALLFGKEEEDEVMDTNDAESAKEIEQLKKEAIELKKIKSMVGQKGAAKAIFDKVFTKDIKRLLSMEELWKTRTRPTTLEYSKLDKNVQLPDEQSLAFDQTVWSLEQNFKIFLSSLEQLSQEAVKRKAKDVILVNIATRLLGI